MTDPKKKSPKIPKQVIAHLKDREGWKKKVYLDSLLKPTAGMGHLLSAAERAKYPVGAVVPKAVLEGWARADSRKAYNAALRQAKTLGISDKKFIVALTSVNFQLGTAWNSIHKNTWKHMVAKNWKKAALEAQNSKWFRQTPVRVRDFQAALRALKKTKKVKPKALDPAIERLKLAPVAKAAAYALKAKHPRIVFTSGRRNKNAQARAMAANVVKNRNWIKQTYLSNIATRKAQAWVDNHPGAKTKAAIQAGLKSVFDSLSDKHLGKLSKHLSGEAFDVKPVTKNAAAIKKDIKALKGLKKFLEKEGGLTRWHVQF